MTHDEPAGAGSYAYAFDNAWHQARQRLAAIEAIYDPGTIRHLEARGVGEGWRCLEVGAGGGSIADWLCRRVGPSGQVLATDIDTRFLDALDQANLEVRRHDIVAEELEAGQFDLVHARLLATNLPVDAQERALRRMAAALRPGGWLLVEEFDFISSTPTQAVAAPAAELFRKMQDACLRLLAARGVDPECGRRLADQLRAHGLTEVEAEGRVFVWRGGSPGVAGWRLTVEQLQLAFLGSGALTEREITGVLALLGDPNFTLLSQLLMAAWGQRPQA